MVDKLENSRNIQNHEKLSEKQIFEKIKEDLNPIQENLSEKKITVNEAKSELKKINEWLQGVNIEQKDKKEIGKAFEKLVKLEKNIDENVLKDEVNEVITLLDKVTKRDLENLKRNIDRSIEVQKGINKSSKNLDLTINDASNDRNKIASWIGNVMKWLNS